MKLIGNLACVLSLKMFECEQSAEEITKYIVESFLDENYNSLSVIYSDDFFLENVKTKMTEYPHISLIGSLVYCSKRYYNEYFYEIFRNLNIFDLNNDNVMKILEIT